MVRWRVVRSHRCVGKSASPVFSSSTFGLAVGPHLMHREGEAGGLVFPDLVWACDASGTAFFGPVGRARERAFHSAQFDICGHLVCHLFPARVDSASPKLVKDILHCC